MFIELSLVRQTLRINGFRWRAQYMFPEEERMRRDEEESTIFDKLFKRVKMEKCVVVSSTLWY